MPRIDDSRSHAAVETLPGTPEQSGLPTPERPLVAHSPVDWSCGLLAPRSARARASQERPPQPAAGPAGGEPASPDVGPASASPLADLFRADDGAARREERTRRGSVLSNLVHWRRGDRTQAQERQPLGTRLAANAYAQGLGITQVSTQLTPFQSSTHSAQAQMRPTVQQEGEARPPVPAALAGHMAPAGPVAQRQTPPTAALGRLQAPEAVQETVGRHFGAAPAEARARLLDALQDVRAQKSLGAAETALLAKSLALAFRSPADAAQALEALRELPLLAALGAPGAAHEPSAAEQQAWQFAAKLQSVRGQGLDLVCRLAAGPVADDRQRGTVRAYFEAAQLVAARSGGGRVDPAALYGGGALQTAITVARAQQGSGAWPGRGGEPLPAGLRLTLAEKALLAIPDMLGANGAQRHACEFAAHMVRGGFSTDEIRDANGRLTAFGKVEQRAQKAFGRHIDRVIGQPGGNPVREAVRRYLAHHGKSPFFAYESLVGGASGTRRFGLSHRGGIQEARAVKDMVDVLEHALASHGAGGGAALLGADGKVGAGVLRDDAALRGLARLAILDTLKKDTVLLTRYADGLALGDNAMEKAAGKLQAMVRDADALSPREARALHTRALSMLRRQNDAVTPQTLMRWAGDAGRPADGAAASRPAGDGPDWRRFEQAHARAAGGEAPPVQTTALRGAGRHAVSEVLADMIRGEELGSGFSLSNGGFTQFSTRNLSETITNLLSGHTLTGRLDLGGGQKRLVNFDSGVNTDRSFLRVGVAVVRQAQAGAGGTVGFNLGEFGPAKLTAAAGGDAQYLYEVQHQEGTVFGFPRHISGGVGGDRDLAARKAQLAQLLVEVAGGGDGVETGLPRPGNAEDRGSLVKAAYQAFGGDISVGGYEVTRGDHTVGAGVSGGLTAGFEGEAAVRATARVGGTRRGGEVSYRDTTGWFRIERDTSSHAWRANVSGTAAALAVTLHAPAPAAAAAAPQIGDIEQLVTGSFGTASADVFHAGKTEMATRIQADGRELPTSYVTVAFDRPASFAAALAEDFDRFAEDKSRKYHGARHAQDPQASVQIEKQALSEYAGRLLSDRDLTASPMLYYEWGDHVPDANLLAAEADLSRRLGDPGRAKAAEHDIDLIHSSPEMREGRFLVTSYGTSEGTSTGLIGMGGLTHAVENRKAEQSIRFT